MAGFTMVLSVLAYGCHPLPAPGLSCHLLKDSLFIPVPYESPSLLHFVVVGRGVLKVECRHVELCETNEKHQPQKYGARSVESSRHVDPWDELLAGAPSPSSTTRGVGYARPETSRGCVRDVSPVASSLVWRLLKVLRALLAVAGYKANVLCAPFVSLL